MAFDMTYTRGFFVFLFLFTLGCSATYTLNTAPPPIPLKNSLLLVNGQRSVPANIKSVRFWNPAQPNAPIPSIRLNSRDRLLLSFDELSEYTGTFLIQFSHRNRDWTKSSLPETWFMDGMNQLSLQGGEPSMANSIPYHHYQLSIEQAKLQFLVSGYYFIHVLDFSSGIELFNLPFIITEQQVDLMVESETLYNSGSFGGAKERLFYEFGLPEFVDMPVFDLDMHVYQDGFLRTSVPARGKDFSQDKLGRFYLEESQAFPAFTRFYSLGLQGLTLRNEEILAYEEDPELPRITLKEDFISFSDTPYQLQSMFGSPNSQRFSRYAKVNFRFNPMGDRPKSSEEVYLVGDFNQWTQDRDYKMNWNAELGLFEVPVLLKEGNYRYSYALKQGNELDISYLSSSLTKENQSYTGVLLYRDPNLQYDRVLSIKTTFIKP